jgi:HEAT repeat protein
MLISFSCENCGKGFEVDSANAGKRCRCRQCGHIFRIPELHSAGNPPRAVAPKPVDDDIAPSWSQAPRSRPEERSLPGWLLYGLSGLALGLVLGIVGTLIVAQAVTAARQAAEPAVERDRQLAASTPPGPAPPPAAEPVEPAPPFAQDSVTQPSAPAPVAPALGPAQPGAPAPPSVPEPAPAPALAPARPEPVQAGVVKLEVSGLVDQETRQMFGDKLGVVMGKLGHSYRVFSRSKGDHSTYTIQPIGDVHKFADMLTFAKIIRIDDRVVFVEMPPLTAAERRPAGTDAIGQAIFDLKSQFLQRRKDALGRLIRMPADPARRVEAAKAIEPMLKDPDSGGRGDAAKALAVWGGPENTPALVAALRDPEFGVRWAVLDTIKALHDPGAAEGVAAVILNDRGKVVEALKAMGPGAEDVVIKLLDHSDEGVRVEACHILLVIGTRKCVPVLEGMIRRTNGLGGMASVACETIEGLQQLPPSERRPPESEFVARVLYDLKSPLASRRRDAVGRLMHAPADESRRAEVASAVAPMLHSPEASDRSDAVKALAFWGGPVQTQDLLPLFNDPDHGVRSNVLDAFLQIKDPAAAPAVAKFLETDRGRAIEVLRAIGQPAEPAVLKYLDHPDANLRADVCKLLRWIGTAACRRRLADLLDRTDPNAQDAVAARETLETLGPVAPKKSKKR